MFEISARWAGWSKQRGVVYYSASGAWAPGKCAPSSDKVPYSNEDWTEESAGLQKWLPTADDVLKEKALLESYYKARPSASRFMGSWVTVKGYEGLGPHGFNVWESNPLCKTMKNGKEVTACNGIDAAQDCALKFMTKEAAVYGTGRGAAHHPTRAFHMLRGEAIAWLYAMALLDAIFMLEKDLKTTKPGALSEVYKEKLEALQPPMPAPKHCKGYHCEQKMTCYTDYQPHYSPDMKLDDLIVGETKWQYTGKGDEPRKEGHLDFKPAWSGKNEADGELSFRIKVENADYVWIFGDLKNSVVYLDPNAAANLQKKTDGSGYIYTPTANRLIWTKKTVDHDDIHLTDLPKGEHVVSIQKGVLTHVITWP
jgi:hypothetical protein